MYLLFLGRLDDHLCGNFDLRYAEIFQMHNIETRSLQPACANPIHESTAPKPEQISPVPYKVLEQMTTSPYRSGNCKIRADYKAVFGE